jgi:hypothetical protein
MFSHAPERRMRLIQLTLFVGWLMLIASLFWDPLSPWLTHPDNAASPLRIKTAGVMVQNQPLLNEPYSLTARVFWAMLVPILPLFLMVFGHEAWRRICPISFASQIPRRLGLNRKRPSEQRRTGKIEPAVVLIKRNSWLQRNAWYLQFGLLFAALSGRLVFINSDRTALAVFLLSFIMAAIVVGYLWGGKTWCNYFCPINVVQKIYTEPRGILESSPHLSRPLVSQSMCRTTGPDGKDVSTCVGCTTNCPDIDLEKSYWESINEPRRRHVYYMFWGLLIGFYGYYYLYAGNWEYYFSGIWTHETGALDKVLEPGLFLFDRQIPLPKIIAAPLVLAIACLSSLAMGITLETLYRRLRAATKRIPEPDIINHCLSFSAYLSINTFYLFGGRPNLMLAPTGVVRFVDILIVVLTTWWFLQAIQRTPFKFRREGLASSLLDQLRRLKVDVSKFLDGRSLDELKPDEVYVLTKVLPGFTHHQKREAYRQILSDAIVTGKTKSTMSLALLHEMRVQMNISEQEHSELLEQMRVEASSTPNAQPTAAHEKWASLKNYTEIVGSMIVRHVESGLSLKEALEHPEVVSTTGILRASFLISDAEHGSMVEYITSPTGLLMSRANDRLRVLVDMLAARFCMHSFGMTGPRFRAIADLLMTSIDAKVHALNTALLGILRSTSDSAEARWNAHNMAVLVGDRLRTLLQQPVREACEVTWEQAIGPHLADILYGNEVSSDHLLHPAPNTIRAYSYREVISDGVDLARNLRRLAEENDDPLVVALVLTAFADFDRTSARDLAENARQHPSGARHQLLDEVVDSILTGRQPEEPLAPHKKLLVTVTMPNEDSHEVSFAKPFVTVGRSTDNDICIASATVAPYHLTIERRSDGFVLLRAGDEPAYVDSDLFKSASRRIDNGTTISFAELAALSPRLTLSWQEPSGKYAVERVDTITKLLWLSRCGALRGMPLPALAKLASAAEMRTYACEAVVCRRGQPAKEVFVTHAGELAFDTLGREHARTVDVHMVGTDEMIGEFALNGYHGGTVYVRSATARLLALTLDEALVHLVQSSPRKPDDQADELSDSGSAATPRTVAA